MSGLLVDLANVIDYTTTTLVTTCSGNVTIAIGDNRLLVCAGSDATGGAVATGITYNGVSLTPVPSGSKSNTQETVDWYYMDNPPVGTATLAVTYPANTNAIALLAIPLINADLTRQPSPGTGTQGVPSASIACSTPAATSNDIAFGATQNRGTTQVAGGVPQTNVVTLNGINGSASFACSSIAGPNAGNFTWTITSGNWSAIGVTVFGQAPPSGYNLESAEYM